MHRRRGRTVGTIVVSAIVVAVMIYAVFGGLGLKAMHMPFVIATAEPELAPTPLPSNTRTKGQ
jgi:hypothetical protein